MKMQSTGQGSTQSAQKHALRIIDGETGDAKTLARGDALFANVNAIDGAGFRTLITSDAGREIVAMKATVARSDGNGPLGIFKLMSECAALGLICFEPIPQRDPTVLEPRRRWHPKYRETSVP